MKDVWVTISFINGEHTTFTNEDTENYDELLEWAGSESESFTIISKDETGKRCSWYVRKGSIVYINSGT